MTNTIITTTSSTAITVVVRIHNYLPEGCYEVTLAVSKNSGYGDILEAAYSATDSLAPLSVGAVFSFDGLFFVLRGRGYSILSREEYAAYASMDPAMKVISSSLKDGMISAEGRMTERRLKSWSDKTGSVHAETFLRG